MVSRVDNKYWDEETFDYNQYIQDFAEELFIRMGIIPQTIN